MERLVAAVTLSSKYQVVIPPSVREAFQLKPGQKIEVMMCEGRITLVQVGSMKRLRGMAPGLDSRVAREADRI